MITKDAVCWPTVETAIEERIFELHLDLETAPPELVPRLQGELTALRWLVQQAETPTIPKLTSMS